MNWETTAGCFLLIFAPYLIAFCAMWRQTPQLISIVLSSVSAAMLSLFVIAVLFEGVRAVCGLTSWPPSLAAVVVLTQVVVQFLVKVAVLWGWVALQGRLRKENQVLVSCRYRFAPVSGAVGLGFGLVSTWATGGLLFDAYRQLPHYSANAAAYDLDVCPQLPVLVHSSLQCVMLTLCHVSWGILVGQPTVALAQHGVQSYWRGLRGRLRPWYDPMHGADIIDIMPGVDPSGQGAGESEEARENAAPNLDTETAASAVPKKDAVAKSPPETLATEPVLQSREEVEGALQDPLEPTERVLTMELREDTKNHSLPATLERTETAPVAASATAANLFEGPLYRYSGIIPMDTIFLSHLDFAHLSLISAFFLQVIFSMMSIVHSGALDMATGREVTTRGCVVSLPIQLVVMTVSVIWALWTLREECVKDD